MAQQHCVSGRSTAIFGQGGYTNVLYHDTIVVRFNAHVIVLNSGGWRTLTTKTRMNQTANQFALGFSVFQRAGEWFVTHNDKTVPFVDCMTIKRN